MPLPPGAGWTHEQDQDLQHYQSLGYGWHQIAPVLGLHSPADCERRYAQLNGLPSAATTLPETRTALQQRARPWTMKQTHLLRKLREEGRDWVVVSGMFPGRSPESCERQYGRYMAQLDFAERRWSPSEDKRLVDMIEAGMSFQEIADRMPGKGRSSCWNRWYHNLQYGYPGIKYSERGRDGGTQT